MKRTKEQQLLMNLRRAHLGKSEKWDLIENFMSERLE